MTTYLTTRWRGRHAVAFACLALFSFSCGEEEEPPGDGELGSECKLESTECNDGLECTEGDDGGMCTIVAGGTCDPDSDVDNGGCAATAECEVPAEDAEEDAEPTCKISEGNECDPTQGDGYCADGLRCVEMSAGGHQCFGPIVLTGMVSDTTDAAAIEGAHVIGINDEGSAVTSVSVSDADGRYSLEVPVPRNEDGSPTDATFTLRAGAQDYQNFPLGIRVALPISVSDADKDGKSWVVENALTDVGLIPLPDGERYMVSGHLEAATDSTSDLTGVLVVAAGSAGAFSATTDADGEFTIFNVENSDYTVSAYASDLQIDPESVSVGGEDVTDVVLSEATHSTATVSGNIQIVNAGGGAVTSVILVVEDTFDPDAARGEVPRGLRAPRTGEPNVDGDFTIEGVPDGNYVVLAAYENDDLVRDPDTNIAGTSFVHLEVDGASMSSIDVSESFKVTEALEVFAPGAEEPEEVSGPPTLRWADDSSEDWYDVRVFDAFGDEVWSALEIPGVSGESEVSIDYDGPLEPGMYYQFRVLSWRQPGNGDAAPISATEDLRGVFFTTAAE